MIVAFIGDIFFETPEKLELEKTYEVLFRFPISQRIEKYLHRGRKWWIHEGSRAVGEAQIIDFMIPKSS